MVTLPGITQACVQQERMCMSFHPVGKRNPFTGRSRCCTRVQEWACHRSSKAGGYSLMAFTLLHSKTVSVYFLPPSFCCREGQARSPNTASLLQHCRCYCSVPLGSGSCTTSNLLNKLWECLHQAVMPSKGQESSPGIPKIQLLPPE